jgi:hypothetical protein
MLSILEVEQMSDQERITLQQYLESRLADLRHHIDERFEMNERQVTVTAERLDRRLELMNALHKEIQEQRQRFAERRTLEDVKEVLGTHTTELSVLKVKVIALGLAASGLMNLLWAILWYWYTGHK